MADSHRPEVTFTTMNMADLLIGRSQSLSNLPVNEKDYEDIRQTWKRKSTKRATLSGTEILKFDGVKAFTPKEVKIRSPEDMVTLQAAQFLESDDFELCGYMWSVRVYPMGVDEHSEHLAVKLQNKSESTINAYYSISLKRSASPVDELRLQMWVEPETDKLLFRKYGHPDSCWGVDDYVPLQELYDPQWRYMDLVNDILYLELSMEVYGDDTLASHPLKKAIETGATEDTLIDIADEDMTTIKNAMKGGVSLEKLSNHQDKLISAVAPPAPLTEAEQREKDRHDREAKAAMELTSVIRTVSLNPDEQENDSSNANQGGSSSKK